MLTYQNIKNNSTRSIDARLYNDEYFDFMLYRGEVIGSNCNLNENLIADFSELNINDGILYSDITWDEAINDGVLLKDIGFTGIDNGIIQYQKDRITNSDFLKILTGSTYDIESGDTRFFMTPITGNTQNFIYPMFLETEENKKYISFKGGFYQGFYKLFGFNYQVLPNGPDLEWNLQFRIRPRSDYDVERGTINEIHPENNGIFFFMGTRAENKFINMYKTDSAITDTMKIESMENDGYLDPSASIQNHIVEPQDYTSDIEEEVNPCENYFGDDYFDSGCTKPCNCKEPEIDPCENYFADDYLNKEDTEPCERGIEVIFNGDADGCNCKGEEEKEEKPRKVFPRDTCECNITSIPDYKWHVSDLYTYKYDESSVNCCKGKGGCDKKEEKVPDCSCDEYYADDYFKDLECGGGKKYASEDYFKQDIKIEKEKIKDSIGNLITKKGYYEIETDNKFLMFDRTPLGLTVKDWIEDTKVILTGRNDWGNINYFPLMNRTKTGYTVNNIYLYQEENSIPYNIYKDIKNNAFCLKITENGAIGYKYGVVECDEENKPYFTVKEEYSKDGIIKYNEWNDVVVKITILNPTINYRKDGTICPDINKGKRKMKLFFFVNGNLVFISEELTEFNFRELNDTYLKQEAVPFNISLGGGTQGLLESILPDYYQFLEYMFPMEKNFCGSFIGDISNFKIYNGYIDNITTRNCLFEK